MGLPPSPPPIRLRGARQNNLQGLNLDLPTHHLIVVTGLSGSGKSSLAFDTLYAEGQRRYIETFSPYARQFFDRMDKPRVDSITGIPPAIALEQRNQVRSTRSTVGTLTEICDHFKVLWPHLAQLHCRQCAQPVRREPPAEIWRQLQSPEPASVTDLLVTFQVPLTQRLSLPEQLALIERQGFQRLLINHQVVRLADAPTLLSSYPLPSHLTVVFDRLRPLPRHRHRFIEACEQAYHFGHGRLTLVPVPPPHSPPLPPRAFSQHLHCASCNLEYAPPSPALFSFNHPLGACPQCKGFGRIIAIDDHLAIPDRSLSLAQGAVKPWQTGSGAESLADLTRFARKAGVNLHVPFRDLPPDHQRWVLEGDPDYGHGKEWPNAWYGVRGYFKWLESKAYKMHVRVLLSRYRSYRPCPACLGTRFQPNALLWLLSHPQQPDHTLSLADVYALPIADTLELVHQLAPRASTPAHDPFALALEEVRARLGFLVEVGLGYLTLDRPTRTLSGGETQRVNLTACLGSRLVHTLFVLDEPSVGLHTRDTERLVLALTRLRNLGNTVVVVEHEAAIMRAADQIIDLGPGHGDQGGRLVAQGTFAELLQHPHSLTGAYLSGRRRIEIPPRRPVVLPPNTPRNSPTESYALADQPVPYRAGDGTPPGPPPFLLLTGVHRHNLHNLHLLLPLGRLVCLSGVSGSGKSTLASELLHHLRDTLGRPPSNSSDPSDPSDPSDLSDQSDPSDTPSPAPSTRLYGAEALGTVLLVDQSPIGRTPRSNPAVYTGAFELLRDLFAKTQAARQAGLSSSAFSFNSAQGQCETCRGAGFEKIEMQFLSDIFIRCEACQGRRYRPHILEIRLPLPPSPDQPQLTADLSIADVLEQSVDDALAWLLRCPDPAAHRAAQRLQILQEVGLGYLRLGQPINTLSGGESQRLKLAGHLVDAPAPASTPAKTAPSHSSRTHRPSRTPRLAPSPPSPAPHSKPTLFVFDEPTTGLHFEDIRILLLAFQRLVHAGHSVLIIEHHLDVLKCADWLIDLGPEGGSGGGRIVVAGTPEEVAACPQSHTGQALRAVLS